MRDTKNIKERSQIEKVIGLRPNDLQIRTGGQRSSAVYEATVGRSRVSL
ncbi:MAG: hypothetical protein AAFY33_15370 [Cyanobacteria bacterium J06643_4]